MKRAFDPGSISDICERLKSALEANRSQIQSMKSVISQAESAADQVPSYVTKADISGASQTLRSELVNTETEISDFLSKLDQCKTRATTLIPAADRQYASETKELVNVVNQIREVLSQLEGFLADTPLTIDYDAFKGALDVTKAKYEKVLDDADQAIDTLLRNVKGAEDISQVFSQDPVNLSTGNFIFDKTDLEIGGTAPFCFRRFYNALNKRNGVLGQDWNHNYEVRLEPGFKETTLILEEGKEETFIKTSTGIYASLHQSNGMLEETEEGFRYETRGQVEYLFDNEGYYLQQTSATGTKIRLHYEEVKGKKQLCKVEKETGESFSLTYDEEGYLTTVTDHSGRQISYEQSGGHLLAVSTADGHWYRYGYSAQGKLECVQNPRDIITVENKYDEKQRITHQTFPDGSSMSYRYDDEQRTVELTERNGSKVTYVHDKKFRDIKHIHSDGEERFEYNQNNQKTLVVDKLGNKTQYAYDGKGNLTRVINALGVKVDIQYESHQQPTYVAIDGKEKVRNHYDENGNLIETKDALGNRYQVSYHRQGQPKEIIQPDGSTVTLSYDKRGNIKSVMDASGGTSWFAYDDLNQVIETIDGNENRTKYTYDKNGNINTVTNARGDTRSYEYNQSGKVTVITDYDKSTIQREYNCLNKPSKVIDQMGRETNLIYDAMWNLARITEPNGANTTYIYNEFNQLGRIKNANGDVKRYLYDKAGNRIAETDEEGNKTTFSYDAIGQLKEITEADGARTLYEHDPEGNLIKVTDALGNELQLTYDEVGNVITEVNQLGESRHYTYTALGKLETITDENGNITTHTYQKGGFLTGIHHPEGAVESFTYDKNGNITSHTDTLERTVYYEYDELNQLISLKDEEGTEKTYVYDSVGQVVSMGDELGNQTHYEYTLTGQLKKVTDALGNETEYFFNEQDYLIGIQQHGAAQDHAANHPPRTTHYERDCMGRLTAVLDPLGQKESYAYDKKGQLLSKIDKDGYLTQYAYTAKGDIHSIRYADGKEVKYSYNPLRQLKEIEDWIGKIQIQPDALGRAKKVTHADGREVVYSYGKSGQLASTTYPDGTQVSYGYDEFARLTTLKQADKEISYGYNEKGFLTNKTFPNGIQTLYQYDKKGQITSLLHKSETNALDEYHFQYDPQGKKTGIRKMRAGLDAESGTYAYEYDALERLARVTKDGIVQRTYEYDAFGNRSLMTEKNQTTQYQYNALNQVLTKTTEQEQGKYQEQYQYDRRGNLTQILANGTIKNQYIYGALNRLEEAVNSAGDVAKYRYNGLGHRIGTQVMKAGPNQGINGRDGFSPTYQIDYLIDLTKEYNNLLQKKEDGITQTYLWDGFVTGLIEEGKENTAFYYLLDEQSSPLRLLGAGGETVEQYGYDEFGIPIYPQTKSQQPFTYIGYQNDQVSQTAYAQAREYLSDQGRFAGRDLVKGDTRYPATLNEYTYCGNRPLCYVDVNGLFWHIVAGAVVGAVVNTVMSVGTSLVTGKPVTVGSVLSSAAGGLVAGGVTAATGNPTLGTVAGGAVERAGMGIAEGKKGLDIVQDVAVGAVTDLAFAKVGKVIGNTPQAKQLTKQFENTKIGLRVTKSKTNYDRQIARGREAFKIVRNKTTKQIIKPRKVVKLRPKTYVNGLIGESGTRSLKKFISANSALLPVGLDLKGELKNWLNSIYDDSELYIEERIKLSNYVTKEMDKILSVLSDEEIKNLTCVE